MKIPVDPPKLNEVFEEAVKAGILMDLYSGKFSPEVQGDYIHWDRLRHKTPPDGLTSRTWWATIKFARLALKQELALQDKDGEPFSVSIGFRLLKSLHYVDREAADAIRKMESSGGPGRFLIRSLIEESMTSSQLEGAATSRVVAKEMLSTGRFPRDQSERMIYNNYLAMKLVRERGKRRFTVDEILELHALLTAGTMESDSDCGRLRDADDNVLIFDRGSDTVLHTPPPAKEVRERLERLCEFANGQNEDPFIHPVVRAIAIHFQIGYDHPFCDGNGRTARVLFYWSMMNSGYWLTEYLSISSVLRKSQGNYMRAYLYTEHDDSDMTYFISQQLDAIEQSIAGLHAYIKSKSDQKRQVHRTLGTSRVAGIELNHRQRALLANALNDPDRAYTVATHRAAHQISYPTALGDLTALVNAGLLETQMAGRAYEYLPVVGFADRLRQ
ncbi:Fic family protein [Stenotrophomonas sp. VV52]|uniref:Fic family protein n=1 Tax=Stenotrophomonas sp. VV52 TaxID=2066958 RepID=UPI000C9EBC05|nr:Fic family protein [Stenotrophomonas sp. VV52]